MAKNDYRKMSEIIGGFYQPVSPGRLEDRPVASEIIGHVLPQRMHDQEKSYSPPLKFQANRYSEAWRALQALQEDGKAKSKSLGLQPFRDVIEKIRRNNKRLLKEEELEQMCRRYGLNWNSLSKEEKARFIEECLK
jgi:hypothetical protein